MGGQGEGVKTSKKRKKAPGADFSKVKHKVGRKLPPKKNETALDTRAKRINLPNQRVAEHEFTGALPSFAHARSRESRRRRPSERGAPLRRRRARPQTDGGHARHCSPLRLTHPAAGVSSSQTR
jgi:hypothetical protein